MRDPFSIKNPPGYPKEHNYDDISLYEKQQLESLAKQALDHFDNLVTGGGYRENKKMPEYVFLKAFLPFFCGEETDPEVGHKITEGHWISFAEGAFMPVDVVDANNEVLFTVPPRRDNNSIAPAHVNDMNNYATVSDQYKNLAASRPAEANRFHYTMLEERKDALRTNIRTLEHLYAWNKIFKRYDRPLLVVAGKSEAQLLGDAPWEGNAAEAVSNSKPEEEEFDFGF